MFVRRMFTAAFLTSVFFASPFAIADEQLERDLSRLLDSDNDGEISDKEAQQGVNTIGAKAADQSADSQRLRAALDKNKDGRVDRNEAQNAVAQRRAETGPGRVVTETFNRFDANGDNALSEREFDKVVTFVSALNPDAGNRLVQLYQLMDRNRDSNVTRDEAMLVADFMSEFGGGKKDKEPSVEDKILLHAEKTLKGLDRDENGALSRREAGKNRRLGKVFRTVDVDENAELTLDEMYKYLKDLHDQTAGNGEAQ